MAFERWRTLFEVVGLVAIVLSIAFLAFEVRQNTQAMRAAAIQDATDVARQQLLMLATDRETHRIEMLGHEDPEQLTPEERRRYYYIIRSFWLSASSSLQIKSENFAIYTGVLNSTQRPLWVGSRRWNLCSRGKGKDTNLLK